MINNINRRLFLFFSALIFLFSFLLKPPLVRATEPLGEWILVNNLPYGISSHSTIAFQNHIFSISGANTSILPNELISEINSDGNLSSWSINKPSPYLYWHSQVIFNDYIYLLGGATFPPTKSTNTIYYAKKLSDGSIGSWSLLSNNLPIYSSVGNALVYNNRIYYAGGFKDSGLNLIDEIYFSDINPDGTLNNWQLAGILPSENRGFGLIEHSGYLFVLGGMNNSGYLTKNYSGKINDDGTIGVWIEQPISEPVYRSNYLKINSTLISIGGLGPNERLNKVYYSELDNNGNIQQWNLSSNNLPIALSSASISLLNNNLYLVGGFGNTGYLNTVFKSKVGSSEPQPNIPVVVVPGMGGSWNTQAMITGGDGGEWKKTPFVKVYDNLRNTFLDNGYTEGDDYFEFYYDWRDELDPLADEFKNYLENTVLAGKDPNTKINIVGHSMGGLVARTYAQKYGEDKINNLVTAGSPHQGTIPAWFGWSGAEMGDHWSWQWIALQLYLQVHKGNYSSPISAIHDLAPSLKELQPNFDFAKNNQDEVISVNSMSDFNSYLNNLNLNLKESLKTLMTNTAGVSQIDSIEWVKLKNRSLTDRLLAKWPDGKPDTYEYTDQGDLTVLKKSALIDETNQVEIANNHQLLVQTEEGIEAILNGLELDIDPSTGIDILPRNPSLIFFLHSPANIRVTDPNGLQAGYQANTPMSNAVYSANDKLLVIYDAIDGDYQVDVLGNGNGIYNLDIGQLTEQGEDWSTTKQEINNGEVDSYTLSFNSNNPKDFPLVDETGKMQMELAKAKLHQLIEYINSQSFSTSYKRQLVAYINRIIRMIDQAILYIDQGNYLRAYRYARAVMTGCYSLRMKVDKLNRLDTEIRSRIKTMSHEAGILSMEGYTTVLDQTGRSPNQSQADRDLSVSDQVYDRVEGRLQSTSGENHLKGMAFSLAFDMYDQGQEAMNNNQFARASAMALLSRLLSLETSRIR